MSPPKSLIIQALKTGQIPDGICPCLQKLFN